jgi:hypothetical protein
MAITLLFAVAPCRASFDAIYAIACLFGCVLDTSEFNAFLIEHGHLTAPQMKK